MALVCSSYNLPPEMECTVLSVGSLPLTSQVSPSGAHDLQAAEATFKILCRERGCQFGGVRGNNHPLLLLHLCRGRAAAAEMRLLVLMRTRRANQQQHD